MELRTAEPKTTFAPHPHPMQKLLPIAVLLLASCGTSTEPAKKPMQKIAYPETRKDTTVMEDHFGTQVADPYR